MTGDFLLSIDVEDVRDFIPDGHRYRERVPAMTETLLKLFAETRVKITFFVTGQVAVRYRPLLERIVGEGHELACHTFEHRPLDRYSRDEFRDDLKRNIDALMGDVVGFRAPTLSMTGKTEWVYEELARQGIRYSSSVLPAKSPLYGWPDFGAAPRKISGVLELPLTLGLGVPFASGIYFRALPWPVIKWQFSRCRLVTSYLHPYDFDAEQERYVHPYTENNRLYQFLMYYRRGSALKKLRALISAGKRVRPYRDFVAAMDRETIPAC